MFIMRMRKKKHFDERMEKCRNAAINPEQLNERNISSAACGKPVHVEIGCGKGTFIYQMARANPDIFFVAVEREPNVLLMAMENMIKNGMLDNLRFASMDAKDLEANFANGSISRIYINFCDPWGPKKQAKRRLTYHKFLEIYNKVLTKEGQIFFKTDNAKLFEFSLNEIAACPYFGLKNITFDLHASGMDNIMTEYEKKFSQQGMPIFRLEAYKLPEREWHNPA